MDDCGNGVALGGVAGLCFDGGGSHVGGGLLEAVIQDLQDHVRRIAVLGFHRDLVQHRARGTPRLAAYRVRGLEAVGVRCSDEGGVGGQLSREGPATCLSPP